jgi:hypothetical protein
MTSNKPQSELEQLIAPEIINDEFHALITRLASTIPARHILEIGSSAGGGSTSAFVAGIRANPARPTLHCMEVSRARFDVLQQTYAGDAFVRCHNVSSVGVDEFPSEAQVADFYNTTPTALNQYELARVLGWLRQDIEYIETAGVPQDGIEQIKREAGISAFDLVLIDGSEFTGSVELDHVYGSTYILMDDVNAFKCHAARKRLLADPAYECIADNLTLRNGYTAFRLKRVR